MNQLSIKITDHHPNIPYKIKDVHEATCLILQGTSAPVVPMASPSYPSPTPPVRNEYVKTETLTTMMAEFTKSMNEALVLSHPRNTFTRTHQDNVECNYCGGLYYIKNCEHKEEDIKSRKCKKNHEGKVMLPNGFYVSRSVPGK